MVNKSWPSNISIQRPSRQLQHSMSPPPYMQLRQITNRWVMPQTLPAPTRIYSRFTAPSPDIRPHVSAPSLGDRLAALSRTPTAPAPSPVIQQPVLTRYHLPFVRAHPQTIPTRWYRATSTPPVRPAAPPTPPARRGIGYGLAALAQSPTRPVAPLTPVVYSPAASPHAQSYAYIAQAMGHYNNNSTGCLTKDLVRMNFNVVRSSDSGNEICIFDTAEHLRGLTDAQMQQDVAQSSLQNISARCSTAAQYSTLCKVASQNSLTCLLNFHSVLDEMTTTDALAITPAELATLRTLLPNLSQLELAGTALAQSAKIKINIKPDGTIEVTLDFNNANMDVARVRTIFEQIYPNQPFNLPKVDCQLKLVVEQNGKLTVTGLNLTQGRFE